MAGNDIYREVTSQPKVSFFSRLSASIKGVLTGVVLFLATFLILWNNEGRAVQVA